MSLMKVLISLSCSLNFFSASSNTSSLNCGKVEKFLVQIKPKLQIEEIENEFPPEVPFL